MPTTTTNNDVLSPHNLSAIVQLCSPTVVSKYLRCCSKGMDAAIEQAVLNYNAFPWRYICESEEDGHRSFVPVANITLAMSSSPLRDILPPSGDADRATLQIDTAEASHQSNTRYEVQRILSIPTLSTDPDGEAQPAVRYRCTMNIQTHDTSSTVFSRVGLSRLPDDDTAAVKEYEGIHFARKLPAAVGYASLARTVCILPILHRPTDLRQSNITTQQVVRRALEKITQDILLSSQTGVGLDTTTYCATKALGGMESEVEEVTFPHNQCRLEKTKWATIKLELSTNPADLWFSLRIEAQGVEEGLSHWAQSHEMNLSWFSSVEGFDGWSRDVRDYIGPMPTVPHEPPSSVFAVTEVGFDFFSNCQYLKSIDVRGLRHVTTVQDRFLASSTLPSISFEGWDALTTIGGQFMAGCSNLKEIDLSPFVNVTGIGAFFLSNCTNLETVTFSPPGEDPETCETSLLGLGWLIELPNAFIRGCSSLSSLSLRPFGNVLEIHPSFLRECTSLRSIDLSPLVSLRVVRRFFLGDCTSLEGVDLGVMSFMPFVPEGMLQSCTSLGMKGGVERIFEPFSSASNVQANCLQLCASITVISTIGLAHITKIGSNFLHGCSKLQKIDLGGLTSVTYIDSSFLAGCEALLSIDFTPLDHGKPIYIGNSFMSECLSLQTVDLRPLAAVSSIGRGCFRNCPKLKMDLTPIRGVLPKEAFGSGSTEDSSLCSIS